MEVGQVVEAVKAGSPVVILDDRKEMEGDLFCAAEKVEPEVLQFMIRQCSGFLCMAMPRLRLEEIGIPRISYFCQNVWMPDYKFDENNVVIRFLEAAAVANTPFHFPVDLKGLHSGISVMDRYATIQALLRADADIAQFECPGHLPLLGSHPQGLAGRVGHTEASVDLCRMAGLAPAGLLCETCSDDGTMMRGEELEQFARDNCLPLVTISQLMAVPAMPGWAPIAP